MILRKTRLGRGLAVLAPLAAFFLSADPAIAQFRPDFNQRAGVPDWEIDPDFKNDVFTFARVRYSSIDWGTRGGYGYGGWGQGRWAIDYPDAELNLAFRLQQMTSLKVNPDAVVVDLAVDDLSHYPFLYIVEPGGLEFTEPEIDSLRKYLLNGGFLMLDDFWGEPDWQNVQMQINRLFPSREIIDLEIDHPIFHIIFDLTEKPQVPGIEWAKRFRGTGRTWEDDTNTEPHYRAVFDDKGRMMLIICQNTDLGDGWEREGEYEWYFRDFAEKLAYPMAINIIFYAMTH
jgi:hypothetical protein